MHDAEYQARCWAENKTEAEIRAEIERCNRMPTRQWNEVGSAHGDHLRVRALEEVLEQREITNG